MMAEKAISEKNINIYYRILNDMSIHQSLKRKEKNKEKSEKFEALKGVSFDVNRGEILGIIGRNGSGKSTLLRAIAGIFQPDEGIIDVHGHQVSLMSIGVGFDANTSGRDNITTSAMLLGYKLDEIKAKIDEIIDFSELGDFIDRPVRTYSSGMYSKLSFSITAIMEPDIMLVDEVLSVGDAKFRKKSFAKMKELIEDDNRTVIIVSHDLGTLRSLCDRVIWLHEGKCRRIGKAEEVLEQYNEFVNK